MKLLRFMSKRELDKLLAGEVLRNNTDWGNGLSKTTSRGFCFFPIGKQYDDPETRVRYMSGVADLERAVIFETSVPLMKSFGMYRDLNADIGLSLLQLIFDPPKMKKQDEYCTTSYSNQSMKIRNIGIPKLTAKGWSIDWETSIV